MQRRFLSSVAWVCFACVLWALPVVAQPNLRATVSPWSEDGTNTYLRIQRNVCVGTGPTAVDALSLCTSPVASATRALLNLSNTALSGGSANGTYLGANPAACTGDFLNFQLANAARATLTCAGALTVVSSTNNLSIFASTTSAQLAGVIFDETGSGLLVYNGSPTITNPIIANISPVANFTLTQNSVTPFVSVGASAIANTLYVKEGKVGVLTSNPLAGLDVNSGSRILGQSGPSGGVGLELAYASNQGIVQVYDRDGSAWKELVMSGLPITLAPSGAMAVTVKSTGVAIGTANVPTGGGLALVFQQGSDPTGINGSTAGIFAKDAGGTTELYAFDGAGNISVALSPHPSDFLDTLPREGREYPWAYSAKNIYIGKRIQVDMAGAIHELEKLTGKKFMYLSTIPKKIWEEDQEALYRSDASYTKRQIPFWIKIRTQ